MSDPNVAFSSQIGWAGPERANRYAIVVDHGKVTYAAKEVDPGIALTGAEAVLARL
jgi:alkyl hydroperoxide reductase 1